MFHGVLQPCPLVFSGTPHIHPAGGALAAGESTHGSGEQPRADHLGDLADVGRLRRRNVGGFLWFSWG